MGKVKFTTTINEELLKAAKIQAIKERKSVAKMIEELLETYLEKKIGENGIENDMKQD